MYLYIYVFMYKHVSVSMNCLEEILSKYANSYLFSLPAHVNVCCQLLSSSCKVYKYIHLDICIQMRHHLLKSRPHL